MHCEVPVPCQLRRGSCCRNRLTYLIALIICWNLTQTACGFPLVSATPKISGVLRLLEKMTDMTPTEGSNLSVPKEIFRKDYKPSAFKIIETNLDFVLDFNDTVVTASVEFRRSNEKDPATPDLVLNGEELTLLEARLQSPKGAAEKILSAGTEDMEVTDNQLVISGALLPERDSFVLKTKVRINPAANTELMGLYKAGPMLCTQCEAEGFRRITYFIDRPDVMSTFKVRLEASKSDFPVLLSNGNEISRRDLPEGRHEVSFEDPFPKASYLFAVVAGDLALKEDTFIRLEGSPVKLRLWSEPKDAEKLDWALQSVKLAMKWDEVRFGRVYDLDIFNLVAVPFFNMGAMENKSLNLFNSAALLASRSTTTDSEFLRIMGVVGHEYFHNWSGNRVTCRDWFQITLKEGFTNFRDHLFSSDEGSPALERIAQVNGIRSSQFVEDAGPLAHPIRPESYVAVDNFYTATVYEKGSEVIRMYQTLLGQEGFRRGTDLYFSKFDGHAVTCDDFRQAMEEANPPRNLDQFALWYSQSGTPEVAVESSNYDAAKQTYTITLTQHTAPTPLQRQKFSLHIPVTVGLLGRQSKRDLLSPPSKVLELTEERQVFTFSNISEPPVHSVLRDFSAPVRLFNGLSDDDVGFLFAYDSDPFNRWDAGQQLMSKAILARTAVVRASRISHDVVPPLEEDASIAVVLQGMRNILAEARAQQPSTDLGFLASCLSTPTVGNLISLTKEDADPVVLYEVRSELIDFIAEQFREEFDDIYKRLTSVVKDAEYDLRAESVAIRLMRNVALSYLSRNRDSSLAKHHFDEATNMNDRYAALQVLNRYSGPDTEEALQNLLNDANGDDGVVDKWFGLQASGESDATLARVKALRHHPLYNVANPNRVRSLITYFSLNPVQFHRADGAGYQFVADNVIELDRVNSRMAARLASRLIDWRRFDADRQTAIREQLKRIGKVPSLSSDTMEIVSKALQM